jgi:NAD+ diphosphatase
LLSRSRSNFLSGLRLDRGSALRADPEELERVWRRGDTLVLPVWRSKHIVVPNRPPEVAFLPADALAGRGQTLVFLGTWEARAYFAADLSHVDEPIAELGLEPEPAHSLMTLREVAPLLPQSDGALLAYASGILTWHRRHRYCGICGSETLATSGGHVRKCGNESCGELHFPRTDPAVIMLVTDGDECLLGRQSSWPQGVYSTLAGFVEPGESLEEAVRREVREETGVELADVEYHSSQPWPFPSSLMLGFTAHATTREVRVQSEELEDARWFRRDALRRREGAELPSTISIARRLIEDWLDEPG